VEKRKEHRRKSADLLQLKSCLFGSSMTAAPGWRSAERGIAAFYLG
jgi:hypothetical protein